MNKIVAMLVAFMATLFTVSASAADLPVSPAPASWISDTSGVLSTAAHARLDAKLKVINQSSANEIAALIVPTLDGENITDLSDKTFKSWGVGKKNLDNGVLVVLAMKEHKTHITTGKGVEGDLPDLKCSDVLQGMRPALRSGNVEGALAYAFDTSSSLIANHKAEVAAGRTGSSSSGSKTSCDVSSVGTSGDNSVTLAVLTCAGLTILFIFLSRRSRRKQEEREAALVQLQRETARLRLQRENAEREQHRKAEQARLNAIPVSVVKPVHHTSPPVHHVAPVAHKPSVVAPVVAATAVAATVAAEAEAIRARHQRDDYARKLREEEEDRRAAERRQRQRDEDDRRRRDEESSSSSSSSSSFDWGGSSGGGSDSGGFGGGDSGGGGSSGDW